MIERKYLGAETLASQVMQRMLVPIPPACYLTDGISKEVTVIRSLCSALAMGCVFRRAPVPFVFLGREGEWMRFDEEGNVPSLSMQQVEHIC